MKETKTIVDAVNMLLEADGKFGVDLDPNTMTREEAELVPMEDRIRFSMQCHIPRNFTVKAYFKTGDVTGTTTARSAREALLNILERGDIGMRVGLAFYKITTGEASAVVTDEKFLAIYRKFDF